MEGKRRRGRRRVNRRLHVRKRQRGKVVRSFCRPVARGGSGGSIEPPISGSVYCAVQSVHSMPHGFGRRQSSRIHNIEQCSAARLAAPRLHKRARRSERADVYNNNN